MKAFAIIWKKFPEWPVLVVAKTASKAKYIVYQTINEVFNEGEFKDLKCRRAKKFDHLARTADKAKSISTNYYSNEELLALLGFDKKTNNCL